MTTITCRPPAAADKARWAELFRGYLTFYGLPADDGLIERVWGWLLDPAHEVEGLVAEADGRIVGLAHYQRMPRTLGGNTVGYLSDLFTDPAYRGGGVGRALIDACLEVGRARGWAQLRWLTQESNHLARRLYDSYAPRSEFILYTVPIQGSDHT